MYLDTQGRLVDRNDETRVVWFSARCSYWCDDWTKLKKVGPGIPVCPHCHCPGMQATFKEWMRSAKRYQDQVADRYVEFIFFFQEKCVTEKNGKPVPIKELYQIWYKNQGDKRLSDGLSKAIDNIPNNDNG